MSKQTPDEFNAEPRIKFNKHVIIKADNALAKVTGTSSVKYIRYVRRNLTAQHLKTNEIKISSLAMRL